MFSPLLLLGALVALPQDTARVVLVATTDIHGHATEWDYLENKPFPGGLARAARVVDSLRARYPDQVVLVDAGDLIQGDPFATYFARVAPREPHPVIDVMNAMGYDAATPGNHEFDFGLPVMRRTLAGAAFPYVSGNIRGLPGDTLVLKPHTVVRRGAVRVGITGFTTPGVMVWSREKVQGKVRVTPIGPAAALALRTLKNEADLKIVVIHSGMGSASSYDTTGVGAENVAATLAAVPDKPDVVVVGHSHREIRDSVVRGVHFVQPKPYAQSLAVVHIQLARQDRGWRPVSIRAEAISLADVAPAPQTTRRQEEVHDLVRAWVAEPVSHSAGAMRATTARAEPTAIINFINETQRKRAGADLSTTPAFNVRAGFDEGDIRRGDLQALYPEEHTLRAVRLSGADLKAYLEQSARFFQATPTGKFRLSEAVPGSSYDIVWGADYTIDLRLPVGGRIRELKVKGRAVQPSDSFTLALNSYRQNGGGGFAMLARARLVYDKNESIRDLLAAEIKAQGTVDPQQYERSHWRIVPTEAAAAIRRLFAPPVQRPPQAPKDTTILRVLAVSAVESGLLPQTSDARATGGAAALKSALDSASARCRCPVLRVAGGAKAPSARWKQPPMRLATDVHNRLGISAGVLSGHDLTSPQDSLLKRTAESRFPWLAANVVDSASGQRPAWAVPYRTVPVGKRRVAVIGYVAGGGRPTGLTFEPGAASIRTVLREIAANRPDLIVVLAQAGGQCKAEECAAEIMGLARELERGSVDVIIGGGLLGSPIQTGAVPVVAVAEGTASLTTVDMVRTPVGAIEVRARADTVYRDRLTPDTALVRMLAQYRRSSDSVSSQVVARVKVPMERRGDQHSLGNLVADAYRNALRADFAVVVNDEIEGDLPAGAVSPETVAGVLPTRRVLVKATLKGDDVKNVLERLLDGGHACCHVSGMVVRYDPDKHGGKRITGVRLLAGRKLDGSKMYTLAATEALTQAGLGLERTEVAAGDALVSYLRRVPQPVAPPEEPRLIPKP